MAHEIDKERLSAFMDGELAAAERDSVQAHLSSCAECAAYLAKIKSASTDFKAHGAVKAPAAVAAAGLGASEEKKKRDKWTPAHPMLRIQLAWTITVAAVIATGFLLKKIAPGIFTTIQGMISGASNNLGQ